jgi:hypothetical protein
MNGAILEPQLKGATAMASSTEDLVGKAEDATTQIPDCARRSNR